MYWERSKQAHGNPTGSLFFSILLIASIVVSCFFQETVAFFDDVYTTWMNDLEYWLVGATSLLLFIALLLIASRKTNYRPNRILLGFVVALAVTNMIGLFLFPSLCEIGFSRGTPGSFYYSLSPMNRARFGFSFLVGLSYFFLVVDLIPSVAGRFFCKRLWPIVAVGLGLFTTIWSFATETNVYLSIIGLYHFEGEAPFLVSFTNNQNSFATLLLIGFIGALFLREGRWRIPATVLLLFFTGELIAIRSRTSFLLAFAMLAATWIQVLAASIRNQDRRRFISAMVFGVLSLLFIILLITDALSGIHPFFAALSRGFRGSFDLKTADTVAERGKVWNAVLELVFSNPIWTMFGLGACNFSWVFGQWTTHTTGAFLGYTHNGFLDQLGQGGILRLGLYVAFLAFFILRLIKALLLRRNGSFQSLVGFLCFFLHGLFETTSFLSFDSKGIGLALLVLVPVLFETAEAQGAPSESRGATKPAIHPFESGLSVAILLSLVFTPLAAAGQGISRIGGTSKFSSVTWILIAYGALFANSLAFFFLGGFLSKRRSKPLLATFVLWTAAEVFLLIVLRKSLLPIIIIPMALLQFIVGVALGLRRIKGPEWIGFIARIMPLLVGDSALILAGWLFSYQFSAYVFTRMAVMGVMGVIVSFLILVALASPLVFVLFPGVSFYLEEPGRPWREGPGRGTSRVSRELAKRMSASSK